MSFNYDTYVGPYVRCAVKIADRRAGEERCVNPECKNHQHFTSGAFCSLCGSPVRIVEYAVKRATVDDWEVQDAINERLVTVNGDAYERWSEENGVHIWKPNIRMEGRNYHLDERVDFYLAAITGAQLAEETAQFIHQFAAELRTLHTYYGEAAVTVHWGIIQDYC